MARKIELGNTRVTVLHTPGHSPESICLLVKDLRRGPDPWFVLTGDTLFVGAVGRPDLPGRARENARELFASLHEKLLTLPDDLEIYPGHFAGSSCGAGMSGKPSSTIAFEKRWNPLLRASVDEFVDDALERACEARRDAGRSLREIAAATGLARGRDAACASDCARTGRSSRSSCSSTRSSAAWSASSAAFFPRSRRRTSGIAARTAMLSFIVAFGVTKAAANYLAGRLADRFGRKHVLVAGWLVAVPVPLAAHVRAELGLGHRGRTSLLGVSQGLTWSVTVIMKIDLAGPRQRGLAMGLNEFAGYVAVAGSALATAWIAAAYGLRPEPFYLGIAFVLLGLVALGLRRARDASSRRARIDAACADGGAVPSQREVFWRTTLTDRESLERHAGRSRQQPQRRHGVGPFPLWFAARR